MATPGDLVLDVLINEDEHELGGFASPEERLYSESELDSRDRGFVYGLAYAQARAANPKASNEEVRQAAWYAAEDAWLRWNSVPLRRDVDRVRSLVGGT